MDDANKAVRSATRALTAVPVGPAGPGLVFRGIFETGEIYYSTDTRVDVVLYPDLDGSYYSLKSDYNGATGTWISAEWDTFTSFKSIATGILLTDDATITKGLVMGSSAVDTDAFIRTYNMSSLLSGNGFYLGGDGKFRLGNTSGDNLY